MKRKGLSILLLVFIFFLLAITIFVVFLLYSDNDVKQVIQQYIPIALVGESEEKMNVEAVTEVVTSAQNEEKISYSSEESEGKFYYEQLNENQKILYNGFQNNKENMISGKYVIQFGDIFTNVLEQEDGTKKLQADYQTAIEAYTHDNADLFYLDITKLYLNIETTRKVWSTKYNVFVGPREGETYYSDSFYDEDEIRDIYRKFENIKDTVLKKMGSNTYKNIKTIHDYLIETIEYDSDYTSNGTYTIYGALIEKKCVCDGYARAFKYLTNSAGIECEIIQGTATNSAGKTENHAWNAVKIGYNWYYVDVTWDDPIIISKGYVPEWYYYVYFLKGSNSFNSSHVLDGRFSEGGEEFSYPEVSAKDYN